MDGSSSTTRTLGPLSDLTGPPPHSQDRAMNCLPSVARLWSRCEDMRRTCSAGQPFLALQVDQGPAEEVEGRNRAVLAYPLAIARNVQLPRRRRAVGQE